MALLGVQAQQPQQQVMVAQEAVLQITALLHILEEQEQLVKETLVATLVEA